MKTLADVINWITDVAKPMKTDVEALKKAHWTERGWVLGAGMVAGLLIPVLLKALGLLS